MRMGLLVWTVAIGLTAQGCVERQLVISTEPSEAEVFLDGREVGHTAEGKPVSVPFDAYGVRIVTARKPGFVPATRRVVLDPPWWQLPVLDFFTDILWPGTIEDRRELAPIVLVPRGAPEDPAAVEARARGFAAHEERRP